MIGRKKGAVVAETPPVTDVERLKYARAEARRVIDGAMGNLPAYMLPRTEVILMAGLLLRDDHG